MVSKPSDLKVRCQKCLRGTPLYIYRTGWEGVLLAKTYDCENCGDKETVLFRPKSGGWEAYEEKMHFKNGVCKREDIENFPIEIPKWLSDAS